MVDDEEVAAPVTTASHDDKEDSGSGMLEDDDYDDDDDSSLLEVDIPLYETPGQGLPKKLEAPPDGMAWKDTAILECLELALKSHNHAEPATFIWKSPLQEETTNETKSWISKPLSLPAWAANPFAEILKSSATAGDSYATSDFSTAGKGARDGICE